MLSTEQKEKIKNQIIKQIEETFPENKKKFAIEKILSMNEEEFEEFLIKNNLIKKQSQNPDCIFCAIIQGMIDSKKIEENNSAIAVLEINPISKGHTLIIPKKHLASSEKLPKNIFTLANVISKRLKSRLKPKEVSISTSNIFGHELINVIPIYKNDKSTERYKANEEELISLMELLSKKKKPISESAKKIKKKEEPKKWFWLPKRIP